MRLRNIRLIAFREIRDHLRDRRTMAMMAVLPLVLYPVVAFSVFQLAQFMEEKPCRVLVLAPPGYLPNKLRPPLLDEGNPTLFHPSLFVDARRQRLLIVLRPAELGITCEDNPEVVRYQAEQLVLSGRVDVAVYFPQEFLGWLGENPSGHHTADKPALDQPQVFYSTASDRSQVAYGRLQAVLDRWREAWRRQQLAARGVPAELLEPFALKASDVAVTRGKQGAALWARLLPILLIIWAATGAFYPAIDSCAGEKERGTLETLLVSPARRGEIVLGKLLAISLFSALTSIANVGSMMLSGWLFLEKLPQFGPPPFALAPWLLLALLPVAVMFAAISLALSAQARSSREAQYYLMPVILITMPLVLLPTTPGVDISLGTSLIPVTGLVLVLKSFLAGQLGGEWWYLFPAGAVTLLLCGWAIHLAVRQFESEAVLFREAEVFSARDLLRALRHTRGEVLRPAHGLVACFVIIVLKLALSVRAEMPRDFTEFARLQLAAQLGVFALPALAFAMIFARRPLRALGFSRFTLRHLVAASLLALLLQPAGAILQEGLVKLYPPGETVGGLLRQLELFVTSGPLWAVLFVLAILPALCEELAFRGVVLGSFVSRKRFLLGVGLSAVVFALAHPFAVQQVSAAILGLLLGLIVITSGSIWPAVIFHGVYNGGMICAARAGVKSPLHYLVGQADGFLPQWGTAFASGVMVGAIAVCALAVWTWGFGWKARISAPGRKQE
ncbi:MAG: ABC transporter permease subunit [Thermoguttaceae bacterium]|nr:ABC transporter permease subunit [Thermoguttaceae bacterium]MDW8077440.1 ABC transporter permease subunit/CPBP intramembrane protease [Thermoguttaceae bacterium]